MKPHDVEAFFATLREANPQPASERATQILVTTDDAQTTARKISDHDALSCCCEARARR